MKHAVPLALLALRFTLGADAVHAQAPTPRTAPGGTTSSTAPVPVAPAPTVTELRRFLEQTDRVLVTRWAPQGALPLDHGQIAVAGVGAFEPGLESHRLVGLRVLLELPELEGEQRIHYLDLHEIESLLRGMLLLHEVAAEGGRGFPTEARLVTVEGFGVGVRVSEGKVTYTVRGGAGGALEAELSAENFHLLEEQVAAALDRLFNAAK